MLRLPQRKIGLTRYYEIAMLNWRATQEGTFMLKLADGDFQSPKTATFLAGIARHIRPANQHLADTNGMLSGVAPEDRAKLHFAILGTLAKPGLIVATLVNEIAAQRDDLHRLGQQHCDMTVAPWTI